MLKPIARDTLARKAAEAIHRFIVQEGLQSGDQIPSERELSESLAVSRNIVREALTVLMDRGVIVRRVGSGTFVRDPERGRATDNGHHAKGYGWEALREARLMVEIGALEYTVSRITTDELAEIERILRAYELKLHSGKNAAREDIEFHLALLRATRNDLMYNMAELVIESFREDLFLRQGALHSIPDDQAGIADHWAILQALQRRDLAAAQEAMRQHFYHFTPESLLAPMP
jgi:GntR family transcriptional repressor for pyruvate dehydrogenase complex